MRLSTLGLIVLAMAAATANAQDAVKVDSKHYKVEFENDQVRVLRITYGPGEKSVMHEHPDGIAISLTDSNFRMTLPGGTTEEEGPQNAGRVTWAPASTHSPENIGNAPAEVIFIELKK